MATPVDYDAIAAKYGGTDVSPSAPPAGPDYDAIAAKYGGTDVAASQPASSSAQPPDAGELYSGAIQNVLGGLYGLHGPAGLMGAGAVKSGLSPLGHLLNFVTKPRDGQTVDPNSVRGHVNDAAQWLVKGSEPQGVWENVGAIGEQTAELMSGEGLLKLAGKLPAVAGAAETLKNLESAKSIAKFLTEHKVMAGLVSIGLRGVQDATTMGAQTYAHTGDPGQAAVAGVVGGGLGAAAGTVGEVAKGLKGLGVKGAAKTAAEEAERTAQAAEQEPVATKIGGVDVPVLKEQLTPEGGLTGVTATAQGRPEVAQGQQEALANVIGNSARSSLRTTLENVNATRPVYQPGNLAALPAPEGTQPFTFTLEGPPTAERTTGELVHPAQPLPRTATASYGGEWETVRTPEGAIKGVRPTAASMHPGPELPKPEGLAPGEQLHSGPEFPQPKQEPLTWEQVLNGETGRPGNVTGPVRRDVVGGGGSLTTTDPRQAEQWLQQLDKLGREPWIENRQQIEQARQSLEDQLGLYHSGPYARRFDPVDIEGALGMTNTYGEAAAQAHGAVRPVYDKINEVTGSRFSQLRDLRDRALNVIRDYKSSGQDLNTAHADLRNIDNEVASVFNGARGVNLNDLASAQSAWRDGAAYSDLDALIERMSNGVTLGETQSGLKRVVTGSNEAFENYLREGNNRANITRLIGADGITDLKKMFMLTSDAKLARKTSEVVENVAKEGTAQTEKQGFLKRLGKPGELLMMANAYGHPLGGLSAVAGLGYGKGMGAGVAMGLTHFAAKQILESAATNGRVINMIDFAVRHNMDPRIYAPLIARTLMVPMQEQQPQQKEETQ